MEIKMEESEGTAFKIYEEDNSTVFEIASDGVVKYIENGKLVTVKNQKELGVAFATALLFFVKNSPKEGKFDD